ncbi:HD domain-containing protein [Winogradskyella sp. PC D3.3]
MNWLEDYWSGLASNYTNDAQVKTLWETIKSQYSSKKRYYHNLSHLYNMFHQLQDLEAKIDDLNSLKFAIWYHDIIYKPTNKDNEEQSALFSENVLKIIKYDTIKIEKVKTLIISTKTHELILTENKDNAYLLDLDLSILGSDWNSYKTYIQNIRKEYKIYPDILYKPGRKKILKHFLERDTLFFTNEFRAKYESQARKNLKQEMAML